MLEAMAKWIVCSAWPYVNNVPHLGTMIGSVLSADVMARYLRLKGETVVFVSGSDEHGTPIEVEARRRGVEPKELTDQMHEYVSKLFKEWSISFDNYTRTENPVHHEFVKDFFMKMYRNGYIFEQEEELPYCENCGIFLPDRFIEGTCPYCGYEGARGDQCDKCGRLLHPTDLVNPHCVFCGSKPVLRRTKHWFFDLPKLQERLRKWLEEHPRLPDNVKKFCLSWLEEGLKPRSVTRDNKWGIPAPFPGAEGKTIYVWFEALLGYVSATKEYGEKIGKPELWKDMWFDENARPVFFIGKDNIPFHAIILPAMLMASGDPYALPWFIYATEYLVFEGEKFSKSRGIGVWIDEALEILPADYWRFALIRMRPEVRDSNFTWKEFYRIINSEMNDDIGNYVNRVLALIKRFYGGVVPEPGQVAGIHEELREAIIKAPDAVGEHIVAGRLKLALEEVLALARKGNQYLNAVKPWEGARRGDAEAATAMWLCANSIYALAVLLAPFTPTAADELWKMLGMPGTVHESGVWDTVKELPVKPGHKIGEVKPLFKKLPADFLEKVDSIVAEAREKARARRPKVMA